MARLAEQRPTHDAVNIASDDDDEFNLLEDDDLLDLDLDDDDLLEAAQSFEAGYAGVERSPLSPKSDQDNVEYDDEAEDECEEDEVDVSEDEGLHPETREKVQPAAQTSYPQLPSPPSSNISDGIKYKIPPDFLKRALKTFPKRWWSHSFYRGPDDERVKVIYCTNRAESEAAAQLLLNESILGFDMEWRPRYSPGIKTNASLIQLASETTIALFHIALHEGTTSDELMAPSLRRILESPMITKTGVAILNADGRRIKKYFRSTPRGLFELSHLHNLITYTERGEPDKINKKMIGLAKLTQHWLGGLEMHKGKVRTSDWSKELNKEQIEYAAADAYAGYLLFRVMDEKRRAMSPVPPLPAFAEEQAPMPGQSADKAKDGEQVDQKKPKAQSSSRKRLTEDELNQLLDTLDPSSRSLYDKLEAHHQRLLERHQGTDPPSYLLVRSDVLAAIARGRPKDPTTLRAVKGVGAVGIQRHGSAWLSIINAHNQTCSLTDASTQTEEPPAPPSTWKLPTGATAISPQQPSPPTADSTTDVSSASRTSPWPTRSKSTTKKPNKALLTALRALRVRLAQTLRKPIEEIATDPLLSSLATIQPRTPRDLEECLDAALPAFLQACAKCGMGLLNFCNDHLPAERIRAGSASKVRARSLSSAKAGRAEQAPLQEVSNPPATAEATTGNKLDVVDLTEDGDADDAFAAAPTATAMLRSKRSSTEAALKQASAAGARRRF